MKKAATLLLTAAIAVGATGTAMATTASPSSKTATHHTLKAKTAAHKKSKLKVVKKFSAAKVAEETQEAKTGKSAQ